MRSVDNADRPWWLDIADAERREVDDTEGAWVMEALNGLYRGDLQPLAAYLRQGYPLSYMIRRELVHSIEGKSHYTPELVQNRTGPGDGLSSIRKTLRQHEIGRYVEEKIPFYGGSVYSAVVDAMDRFELSESTVRESRRVFAAWKNSLQKQADAYRAAKSNDLAK